MLKTRAVIDWIPGDQGGRKRPPAGAGSPPYVSVVRFPDANEPWPPSVAWSLVVEKDEAASAPLRWLADVHFLVEEAPHEALRPGRRFELYEGARCVAHGRLLGDGLERGPTESTLDLAEPARR